MPPKAARDRREGSMPEWAIKTPALHQERSDLRPFGPPRGPRCRGGPAPSAPAIALVRGKPARRCPRDRSTVNVALGERARALKTGQTELLRLGATPQVIENLLAEFLASYRRRYPEIEVHLIEDGGAQLPNRLERGDVKLAIMPANDQDFRGRLLYPMHLLAVLPRGHSLSRRPLLEIGELSDEPLLLLRPGFATLVWFEAACHVARIKPRVLLHSAAPQTVIELAKSGYGIAVVPSQMRISREGVRIRSSSGERPSGDGRPSPGTHNDFWPPMRGSSSTN